MRWSGGRRSENVEDRRGMPGGTVIGGGLGTVVLLLLAWYLGIDPTPLLQGIQTAKVEEITYTSTGNAKVMGWVVKPPSFDPSKKYPLILEIHGGPFGNYNVGFNYMFQNFAANGFVVLVTNPRGSTGYGSDFINGIDHNYPGPDYDDLMAGVDTVVGRGYIDTYIRDVSM